MLIHTHKLKRKQSMNMIQSSSTFKVETHTSNATRVLFYDQTHSTNTKRDVIYKEYASTYKKKQKKKPYRVKA